MHQQTKVAFCGLGRMGQRMAVRVAQAGFPTVVWNRTPRAADVVASAASAAPVLPLFGVFAFITNALLFTDEQGNISSGYPRRMFALPVRTAMLALCPMAYAAVVLAIS